MKEPIASSATVAGKDVHLVDISVRNLLPFLLQ